MSLDCLGNEMGYKVRNKERRKEINVVNMLYHILSSKNGSSTAT